MNQQENNLQWVSGDCGITLCMASSYKIVKRPHRALKDIIAIHTTEDGRRINLYEGGRNLAEAKNICEHHHLESGGHNEQ